MQNYDLSKLNVLVVDDYRPMRIILVRVLLALGITEIAEAEDGKGAFEQFEDFKADIIVLDNKMKPMDGIELTRKIRAGEEGIDPFIPIIMVSGFSEMDNIMEARDAGVSEFLAKPISAKLMFLRLRAVIENQRSFVRTQNFFGPDRRRRLLKVDEMERRGTPHQYKEQKQRDPRDPRNTWRMPSPPPSATAVSVRFPGQAPGRR